MFSVSFESAVFRGNIVKYPVEPSIGKLTDFQSTLTSRDQIGNHIVFGFYPIIVLNKALSCLIVHPSVVNLHVVLVKARKAGDFVIYVYVKLYLNLSKL